MCQETKQHTYCRAIKNAPRGGVTMCRTELKTEEEQRHGFCQACDYPGIEADYQHYKDLREEGYGQYEAALKAGFADPN